MIIDAAPQRQRVNFRQQQHHEEYAKLVSENEKLLKDNKKLKKMLNKKSATLRQLEEASSLYGRSVHTTTSSYYDFATTTTTTTKESAAADVVQQQLEIERLTKKKLDARGTDPLQPPSETCRPRETHLVLGGEMLGTWCRHRRR